MKLNEYLTEDQARYIASVKIGTDTKGMDLGVAHNVVVLENSIRNFTDTLTNTNKQYKIVSEKQNENGFKLLKGIVGRRDSLIQKGGGI